MKERPMEDMDEVELREFCNHMARSILRAAREKGVSKLLFALVMFNDPALGQYVCNCERSTMMDALTETVRRIRGEEDVRRDK